MAMTVLKNTQIKVKIFKHCQCIFSRKYAVLAYESGQILFVGLGRNKFPSDEITLMRLTGELIEILPKFPLKVEMAESIVEG